MGYKKRFVNKLSSGKNAYRIITGAMTTWILMIAFEADHSVPTEIVLDLAIFAVLLLVTYVFATIISEEIIVRRQTSWKRIFEIVLEVSPVLLSTVPPFLIFVIASFGIITVKTGLLLSDLSLLSIFDGVFSRKSNHWGLPRGAGWSISCLHWSVSGYTEGLGYLILV